MVELLPFADFLTRLRRGDDEAACELVRRFEPMIHHAVRQGIKDHRLCLACDPLDICQTVLSSFFARVTTGGYQLERPEHLVGLLLTITRNVLASEARRQRSRRRDVRRIDGAGQELLDRLIDRQPSPCDLVLQEELLDNVHACLTDEECLIAELHDQGLHWGEVAERMGGSGGARRMQLMRALQRVRERLRKVEPDENM